MRSLQEHYRSQEKEAQEEVCLIQGAKLILGSDKGRLQKFSERDCLLVNLSQQFIMNIEVGDRWSSAVDCTTVLYSRWCTKVLLYICTTVLLLTILYYYLLSCTTILYSRWWRVEVTPGLCYRGWLTPRSYWR